MKYRDIHILETANKFFCTRGLVSHIENEVRLKSFNNAEGELALLRYIIDYVLNESPIISNNETISYGLWLLKFIKVDAYYDIHELDDQFKEWQEGADNAIYYIEQQKAVCNQEATEFKVPGFAQNIAISEGVIGGLTVHGIRYDEPEHMSGWYLTAPKYNGDIKTMSVVSLQSLVVERKDLLQFLALPPGFIFEITDNHTCRIGKAPLDANNN